MDLAHTVTPKSDQLNADDLLAGPVTITITAVKDVGGDQPIVINYEGDNGRPYKPGKSMRRVMIAMWGSNGNDWIGQSIEIYNDPAVRFGGQEVGGIRINRATGIAKPMNIILTVTRAKRAPYTVKPLVIEQSPPEITEYPEDKFQADLPKIKAAIESGKSSRDSIIAHLEKTAPITTAQREALEAISPVETTTLEEEY
jgi:hypothetical protein